MNRRSYRYGDVLKYIIAYKTEHDGLSPSLRDICLYIGISSTSVANYILASLEREGRIRRAGSWKRGIIVTGGKWEYTGFR